jgi:ABC-type molybdate transport system substrate-binding protein
MKKTLAILLIIGLLFGCTANESDDTNDTNNPENNVDEETELTDKAINEELDDTIIEDSDLGIEEIY